MNVLKIISILFICLNVYATDIYIDGDLNDHLPKKFEKKPFTSYDKKGFFLLTQKRLPDILNNNFIILNSIYKEENYIISYKYLNKIDTLANPNLAVKFLFEKIKPITYKKATIEDFKQKKVDAILVHKKIYIKDTKIYNLKDFGIITNKYFLVAKKEFLKNHKKDAELLNSYLPATSSDSLILASYYFNKKLNLSDEYYQIFEEDITNSYKVVLTPYWPPFNIKDGNAIKGIAVDFWKLIAKKANIKYTILVNPSWSKVLSGIKNKIYDINPATSATPDRKKYAIFSNSYIDFPLAIACRNDLNIKEIRDIKSLAVGKNYTAYKMMKKHYPNLNYKTAFSVIDAFKLVEQNKAQCVVDMLPTVVWLINQNNFEFIKVYFKTPFTFKVQVMIRKDLIGLRNKINKAINNISIFEKNKIISKYIGSSYIVKKNYTLYIVLILGIIIVLSGYFLYRYKRQAQIDYLTKIYNRSTIDDYLKRIVKKKNGAVIFFDIDHFKQINDTYGHKKGDFVLQKLAYIIKQHIRKSDIFGRWGGEEFLIILPDVSYTNALKIAEKLRKIVENTDFDGIDVTISLGVNDFEKGDNIDEIIKQVDEALYEAKNSGRNQIKGVR